MTQKWIIFSKRYENVRTKFEKVNDFHVILGISENPNPTWVPGFFEIKTQNPLFQNPTSGLKTLMVIFFFLAICCFYQKYDFG